MLRARAKGWTTNVDRLVSYTATFVVVLAMFGLAVLKWQHYLDRLDATAAQGVVETAGP